MRAGRGHECGGVAVVEELRQRIGPWWDVTVEDRVPGGRVGPVPFDEPLEEDPDHPQPLPLRVLRHHRALGAGLGGEPDLVVLDVRAADLTDDGHVGVVDDPAGELTQRVVGRVDTARRQERRALGQVSAHRCGQLRCPCRQVRPIRDPTSRSTDSTVGSTALIGRVPGSR